MHIIIVTGLSGSGKSVGLRALEDYGFYCIDNLPATLLLQISHHLEVSHQAKVAISIDSRSTALDALPSAIEHLKSSGHFVHVLFLESNIETLVKRFSETRRKHPLSNDATTLAESIAHERELLTGLVGLGLHIDTSNMSANALRTHIRELVAAFVNNVAAHSLVLLFTSFGFKNGIPLDADYLFDVRSLPNPHYDPLLRPLTGKDQAIVTFLEENDEVLQMRDDIRYFIEKWLPSFESNHRSYLTVAIGCTGGQHRSVYFVEQLAGYFGSFRHKVIVRHRDMVAADNSTINLSTTGISHQDKI